MSLCPGCVNTFNLLSSLCHSVNDTFVSADVHKNGFIVFIASSLLHMLITCRLWHVIRRSYVNPEVNKRVHDVCLLLWFKTSQTESKLHQNIVLTNRRNIFPVLTWTISNVWCSAEFYLQAALKGWKSDVDLNWAVWTCQWNWSWRS